ncbi:TPA: efflux RND transporter permease subunit [Legionella pneumophila]|nr:efflux RND transporter permease subunit [Legionella pneumophila]HEN4820143.1 efflux RND transporter permease subunit [Legionella pneumophila]HEN5629152.1 efflux RND transporter permease subunit [Legionella pneumophila]HEN5678895.1 efflux RND transporter permease subunit [Legionella pneumophila]HEN5682309.1 efflux RND transporter permease subunit [Legionella pneumophila]
MWIVRIALARPYTFIVLALLLLIIGPLSILRTPTDIFPDINIPVISVIWSYSELPPDDMGNRITSVFERVLPTTVNDIEHIESESLIGVSVVKLFFQPGVNIELALSQVTSIAQTILRSLPEGTLPPLILNYKASTVPILQLVLSSDTIPEQELNDLGNNFIRPQLAPVAGASLPYPYGGKVRQVQVDLDLQAMQTYGVSPLEINTAISAQNLIIPAGTQKIGDYEYIVKLNSSPLKVNDLNDMPVKTTPGRVLYIRDVAHVRDGFTPQTNIVRVDGKRAVMMSVQKTGGASTLGIIKQIKALLPKIKEIMPAGLNLGQFADQSIFVTAAIQGVITEGIIAASLTALMILIFLGSVRSTLIISISIPLSIIGSLTILSALGETINIMTLGGLALAVGILVDDATVAIENINWNLEQGKEVEEAILDGAHQIAIPALVSTLCITIVFVPMFYLGGVAQYLFVPLAEAVIFAMLISYLLSRTLIPTLAKYLLHKHDPEIKEQSQNFFVRLHHQFEKKFEIFRERYSNLLNKALHNATYFVGIFLVFVISSVVLLWPWLGSNFFPNVDAGLHIRAPTGTRVEVTARYVDTIDKLIRTIIPPQELDTIVDNIGLPVSGINLSYSNSAPVGPEDADILISLKEKHHSVFDYQRELRTVLNQKFPDISFAFLPADIVNQTINFGLPSPIDIQIIGLKQDENRVYAKKLMQRLKKVPGLVDIREHQAMNYPELFVDIDRSKAKELGITQRNIAMSLFIALSGSFQTSPTFWLSPENNVSYPLVVQAPQYVMNSLQALRNIMIDGISPNIQSPAQHQILGALGTITRKWTSVVESHYNVMPVIDIFAATQDRDLGSITHDINQIIAEMNSEVPLGSTIAIRGQIDTQHQAFQGLYWGIVFSVLLIYLLIVINFQSWVDPFIIITALPAAIAGIAWFLFITCTTLSVPALTGAIMCMGVATSNSILIISFARQHLLETNNPLLAAMEAGRTRIRPVLMTASAMIIGMMPMALGLGDGGEQNAPLGRAVIGGLSFATIATLFFVPTVFYIIHNHQLKVKQRNNHA